MEALMTDEEGAASLVLETRRAMGMTAIEFGARMRKDKATIWRWEHGRSTPSFGECEYMRGLLAKARASRRK